MLAPLLLLTASILVLYCFPSFSERNLILFNTDGGVNSVLRFKNVFYHQMLGSLHERKDGRSVKLLKYRRVQRVLLLPSFSIGAQVDAIASILDQLNVHEKNGILQCVDVSDRLDLVQGYVLDALKIRENETDSSEDDNKSSSLMKFRGRGGEKKSDGGDEKTEVEQLEQLLLECGLTPEADAAAKRELKRLKRIPASHPDYHNTMTYLQWIAALPWSHGR